MSLILAVMKLARARTLRERIEGLRAVAFNRKIDPAYAAELQGLLNEAQSSLSSGIASSHALQPLANPTDSCKDLVPLALGEKPILTAQHEALVDEWLDGWLNEGRLRDAGIRRPGPLLLHGATGSGKTMLTRYLAARLAERRRPVVVEAHRVVGSLLGETGSRLDKAFSAGANHSGFVVIEEIDGLAERRPAQGSDNASGTEHARITIALMRLLEASDFPVVATTNRSSALDPALLRRFDFALQFDLPSEEMRRSILSARLNAVPPDALVALPLAESLPKIDRIRRKQLLADLSLNEATARVLAA